MIVFWIIIVIVIGGTWISVHNAREARKEEEIRALAAAQAANQIQLNHATASKLVSNWIGRTIAAVNDREALLALSPDGDEIAILYIAKTRPFRAADDLRLPISSLLSAELQNG
jgi:hypothetical protein